MKGYSIYRDNTVIYEFVVDDTISKSLSGNKYVSFTISSKNDLDLKIGDYVLVGNEKYEIFEPIDIEESNGVFTYPLTFYFQGYKLNNSIITDEGATTFAYHGEVSDFMTLLIDSLNEDYPEFTLGTIQNGSILDLSFDNSNCMAALQTVCENAKMEWDITGTIITVKSRIGEETDHVFEYGRNKGSYSVKLAKVANASITTRMIGKGGTLNLPADYVSPDSPKRLNLGNEVLEKNVNKYGKITGVYINENIYPRLINKTVLGVTIPDNIEEAGSWKIKLDIPFNLSDYYADNEVPVVKFQTGDLTGLDFEIVKNSWNNTDKTLSIIVKEEEDGYYLPNANRQPRVGDVFVLLNINMPQSYIDEATQELREATQNELNKKCEPQYAPSLSVQKHYIKKKGISLNIGDGITVKIGRRNITTRIIGTTETSDDIRVELGDQMLYTYDTKVNNTIEQIQFTLKQLINIDDIKRLFYNLINAWYPKWFNQKLHKDADVKFNSVVAKESIKTGKVTAEEVVSENFTSGLLGVGHRLWNGVLEVSELIVRKTMHVFEIIVQKITSVNGSMLTTPGGGIRISEVEELEDGYKCFFNNDDGTIPNPFVVGDQALHQVFTGKNISRYWRLVTEVGDNYFVLSKTDCESGSDIPKVEDEIIQFGNRTDRSRQNAVLTTSYGLDAPYTAYYSNVNSYSLEGKEDVREGNLRGINDPDFGQLQGSGFYGKNVYLKGIFRLLSGKTVEESIGDVQSNLDNLQVGETNLLDNSNKGWKNTGYPIATIYLGDYKPKQGEECTIVIKGKLGANKTNWAVYNSGGNVVLASFYPGGPDTDYIALKTFKWTLGTPAVDNTFIRIYPMPNSVSVESEIEWVKLVLGNKTSLLWTPSINDQRQIAIDEAGKVVDGIQIGSQNLISKKMMLKWNEKNKDIAVWGQDEDGIYLDVAPKLLFNNITTEAYNPVFDIKFKANTQYVLSVEWKHKSPNPDNTGLAFYIEYDDGTRSNVFLTKDIKTKTITNVISEAGKTISKIYSGYGNGDINALIYNISLIEGNKPLQGFPVAAEDQTGANNVNLAEGTKGPFTVEGEGTNAYAYKALYIPVIKPNTVYYVNAQNIEFLSGNISKCDFILYDKAIKKYLTTTYHHLYDKNGGILITKNDFEAQEGYLLCYAGESGHITGNSVRFTEVMLVEGFLPASVWTPSFSEQQAEIKTITKTLTEIKAENGEISLRVNEVSERVEEAKQEAIDTANEYATLKSYRETWIDLTAEKWNRDMYYPVTIKIDITIKTRIQVDTPLDYVNVSWGTHESGGYSMLCAWTVNGGGWGSITVQRVIESSQWGWTELDPSSPNGLKIPFGSIGQLTNNNEEYILLRGGGKYRFRITNNCVPIEHNSRYTGYGGQHVDPQSSVIGPVLTNVMKTEFDSQITQLKDSIDLRVTKTDYDKNNQVLNQSIGKLQTSYNSISGTVSSLNTRLQTVEKAGYITTSQGNTLYASKKLENGNELISYINQDATNTTIKAKNINLNGAISANGNVQITTDGKLIAVNGQFTGKITATEGEIAGLKLSNNGLKSDDFNASSKVGSCYAKNGFSVYASGSGILAPSTGALQAGIITAIGTNSEIIGLEIIAKNTSGNATLSKITALKLRAIDYVDDSKKMAPTAALIVEEGVSIFNGDVEVNGKSTFNGAVYFKNVQNVNGKSNYYLCIDRSTGQLYYR